LVALSVHLAAAIISLYDNIPKALAIIAIVVGFLFAISEAGASFLSRRGLAVVRDSADRELNIWA
jgi:hypothetical protein